MYVYIDICVYKYKHIITVYRVPITRATASQLLLQYGIYIILYSTATALFGRRALSCYSVDFPYI